VAGAFVGALTILLGIGVVHAGAQTQAHIDARRPGIVVNDDEPASLLVEKRVPIVPGGLSQIPVLWLEPVPGHEADSAIVPPGLSSLPEQGEAVLSPGLIAAGYTAEDFGFAPSGAGTGVGGAIGDEGLASRSEGFAYVRAVGGRSLDADEALRTIGYVNDAGLPPMPVDTALDTPTLWTGLLSAVWLLWIPGLYLLIGAARAASPIRQDRATTLWSLGISAGSIRLLAALETTVLTAIGTVAALLVWVPFLQHRQTFPLTDGVLLPGALAPPWWLTALGALAVVALAAGAAAAGRVRPVAHARSARPVRNVHLIPLALSFALMFVSPVYFDLFPVGGSSDIMLILLFLGAIGTFLSLPLALPMLTSQFARTLRGATTPSVWLAGRTLTLRRHNLSRPGAMVGGLVFIAGAAFALLQGAQTNKAQWWPEGGDRNVWEVNWQDVRDDDYPILQARARAAGVDIVAIEPLPDPSGPSGTPGPRTATGSVTFASCDEAQQFFDVTGDDIPCSGGSGAGDLPAYLGNAIAFGSRPDANVTVPVGQVLVSAPQEWSEVDVLALLSGVPALNANILQGDMSDFSHPGTDWFVAGWAAASLLLLLGLLRELGDRILLAVAEKDALVRAGLQTKEADDTYVVATMTPVLIALPIGFVAAVLFALRGYSVGVTAFNLGLIAAVSLTAGALALTVILVALRWQRHLDG
ncbi:MAG: hypothetical protein H7Y15_16345, partial [Pseudonocardia sp.]|nr:hypothetical protein [Pseudonocardia sp.]